MVGVTVASNRNVEDLIEASALTNDRFETTGLYRLGRSLLVNPGKVQFPYRCVFTNESVDELSIVKLSELEVVGVGPVRKVLRKDVELYVPLSDTWRIRKLKFWLRLASVLKIVGLLSIIVGFLYVVLFVREQKEAVEVLIPAILWGAVLFLVGWYIPRLEDTVDVNCIPRVKVLKTGWVIIPNASKEFLASLPVARKGWVFGFFGNETIRV